jgi:hypothetical protein
MSVIAVAVVVGFICCALVIRALAATGERAALRWESTERARIAGDMRWRAMMEE